MMLCVSILRVHGVSHYFFFCSLFFFWGTVFSVFLPVFGLFFSRFCRLFSVCLVGSFFSLLLVCFLSGCVVGRVGVYEYFYIYVCIIGCVP